MKINFEKGDWFIPLTTITEGDNREINIGAGWVISAIVAIIIIIAIIV